jgi:acetyl-CoA synthetase
MALTRHVRGGAGDRPALRWRPRSGPPVEYSYLDLDHAVSRFASGLAREGIRPGETVAVLAGRIPELVVAVLGALRAGAVVTVLFSSFGPDPVARRLARSRARLLVTTPRLYREKVAPARAELPFLARVLLVDHPGRLEAAADGACPEGTQAMGSWLALGDPGVPDEDVDPEHLGLLHFTSGTTGEPKGVVHVHDAVVAHAYTAERVLGLGGGTRYWCTADPGWVTGISYGILGPLATGSTVFMDEDEFDPTRWWENLEREGIQVLYTSPTALRLLRRMTSTGSARPDLPLLQSVFTVGEPLAPAESRWGREVMGVPVRDTWWQTETGCIVVATPFDGEVREGFIGRALPPFEVACLVADGEKTRPARPDEVGELCVRRGWPSMFRAYLDDPDLYRRSFAGDWYRSGDVAEMHAGGWVHFLARHGDAFKSAGHMVAPVEVEAVLLDHPAVVDAAVAGRSDELAGTVIEAHVVLAAEAEDTDGLVRDILAFARSRLGPALAPRVVHVRTHLPRTPSGKIVRQHLSRPSP